MALKKICRCGNTIDIVDGMCVECKVKQEEAKKQRHKDYKLNRKDIREQQFYNTKAWHKVRNLRLIRDNGLCQVCLKDDKIVLANTVHHKIELKQDWNKRLDIDNLMTVCESCHNRIHGK
jgi:5-methylcytosine-specific restriction enzyme A